MTWNQLAWKTPPTVPQGEVEAIQWLNGVLEIPRYGYLNATELERIREVDPANKQIEILYRESVNLAATINEPEKWNSAKCYGLLTAFWANINRGARGSWTPSDEEAKILVDHKEIALGCLDQLKEASKIVATRTITVILQRNTPSWTDEMTASLPGHLQDKIYEFANEEASAGMGERDLKAAQEALEDDLKKLQEESRSILRDQTSLRSTGNAKNSGQRRKNLAATTTGSSLATTSSRRSKKASKLGAAGFTKTS